METPIRSFDFRRRTRLGDFRRRIRLGFAASLLSAVVIAGGSYYAIQSIRQSVSSASFDLAEDVFQTRELETLFDAMNVQTRAYLYSGNEEFLDRRSDERTAFYGQLDDLSAGFERSRLTDGVRLTERIRASEAMHETAVSRITDQRRADRSYRPMTALRFESDVAPMGAVVRRDIEAIEAYQQSVFEKARRAATRAATRETTLFLALSAIAICLAAVLAVVLARTLYRALSRVTRSEAFKDGVLRSALDCIISIDDRGNVIEFNEAAETTFGYSRSDVMGKEMAALLLPEKYREAHRNGLKRYLDTGYGRIMNRRVELSALRSNGDEFPIELTVTRTPVDGPPVFTAFVRDITERKIIEQDKSRAIEMRDELVAVVSHELKNPLTALVTNIELIQRSLPCNDRDSQIVRIVDRMKTSTRRMSRLTGDLLDIAKIEVGKLSIEKAANDVRGIVDEAIELFRPLALEKKISLVIEVPQDAGTVLCDRGRVIQVLSNLLGNAIKFTPPNGQISVGAINAGVQVTFRVRDTGPGIPTENLQSVFDRFWQAKQTAFKGTGLGLSIAKGIVERHGGRIWVESAPGKGAAFFFSLPTPLENRRIA